MLNTAKRNNFTPYAIGLLAVILLLLVLYPRQKPAVAPTVEKPIVTVENEFSQAKPAEVLMIKVTSPTDGSTSAAQTVIVKGKTAVNAEVYINEVEGRADALGNFSISYSLEEGENYLLVVASDDQGNSDEVQLTVKYEG